MPAPRCHVASLRQRALAREEGQCCHCPPGWSSQRGDSSSVSVLGGLHGNTDGATGWTSSWPSPSTRFSACRLLDAPRGRCGLARRPRAVGTRLPAARSTGQSWRPCGKHCVLTEPRDLWGATRTPVCGARPLHEGRRMGGQAAAPRVSREHSAASLVPRGTQKSPSGRIWGSCKS